MPDTSNSDAHPMGLVLTGGGARGAYQAGVLVALAELTRSQRLPFPVIAGSSAGAINASYLAARADRFVDATRDLAGLWTTLEPERVFRTDVPTLAKTAVEWITDLGLGGWIGQHRGRALLDVSPLRHLVTERFDSNAIAYQIACGRLHGIGLTATHYESGLGVTFFQGASNILPWNRITRVGVRTLLTASHVLASSAIPIFFPAVQIGNGWYADGSIRLVTPLSPAIRMGARRILAVAVRTVTPEPYSHAPRSERHPSPAEIAGFLLNAVFVDALEADVERMLRVNQTLTHIPSELRTSQVTPLNTLDVLVLRPSIDPSSLVLRALDRFPASVRHMFRGLGASEDAGWELLSYFGFESAYTTRLFQLGYDDTMARAAEISAFLTGSRRA